MIMTSSLLKNIIFEFGKLMEQAAPTAEPIAGAENPPSEPPALAPATPETPSTDAPAPTEPSISTEPSSVAATPNASPAPVVTTTDMDSGDQPPPLPDDSEDKKEEKDKEEIEVAEGQPPIDKQDPINASYDWAVEKSKGTIDPEEIYKALKGSIQLNFGKNMKAAWPIVQRLKDTENALLYNVAQRLELFIGNQITENTNKGKKTMKVSRKEIRELVREALNKKASKSEKEISLTKEQFEKIVRNVVQRKLQENSIFDKHRSMINQERSSIESQLVSTEIREMAIDLFEKICQKAGLDAGALTPEAMQFVEAELDRMITSAQEISNKLIQVAAVVKKAHEGAPKVESGE
jgi:hypothetical protein